jgi:uncharacterized protein YggT (Ycf19 family)
MTDQEKLTIDESRKIQQHEAIKDDLREGVRSEVNRHANQTDAGDQAKLAAVGNELKNKAIHEVGETERELDRTRGAARVSQFLDYVFYIIYGMISLEILLDLAGANQGNAFRQFVAAINAPLLAPFKSLLPDPAAGSYRFRISYIVALIVYLMLHLALTGLLRLLAHRKTEV